jgi:hypothetical protein
MSIQYEWVCFDIPFFLQAPDSFDGNEAARFYPSVDGDTAELRFKRDSVETRGGETFGMAAGDRLGNVSYTRVRVGVGDDVLEAAPEPSDGQYALTSDLRGRDGWLIGKAIEFLNQFLRVYRVSLEYYWIRPLTPQEIVTFELVSVHENSETVSRHRKITPGALQVPNSTLDIEQCRALNALMQGESSVPLTGEIDLDVQDKIDLEEANLAVLNAERFFELWVKNAFEVVASERGWSEDEIRDLLKKDNGEYEYISNIAGNFIGQHLDFAFSDTDEYDAWKEDTHDVRNSVAHEGYIASVEEAIAAYKASADAVLLLAEEFSAELTGTELEMPDAETYWERNMLL